MKQVSLTAAIVFLGVVAAIVVLVLKGADTTALITVSTPVLGALYVTDHLNRRTDVQDRALSEIKHNTNGVLTARIEDAVSAALDKRDAAARADAAAPFDWGANP